MADLGHHLDIEPRALLQALRLDEPVCVTQHRKPVDQLFLDGLDGFENTLARGHVVTLGIHGEARNSADDLAGEWIEVAQILDFVVEELDPHRVPLRLRRMDIDDFATNAIGSTMQLDLVSRVLQLGETPENESLIDRLAPHQVQHHRVVGGRIAEAVDRRHGGHDDAVTVLQQRLCRRQSHLLDMVVDRRIFLDVRVGRRDIGFRLVIVVVGDEILDSVVWKELTHLPIELSGQRLVGSKHECRTADPFDDLRHRECLAGPRDTEQCLMGESGFDPFDQPLDRSGLIACRREVGHDGESARFHQYESPEAGRGTPAHTPSILTWQLRTSAAGPTACQETCKARA